MAQFIESTNQDVLWNTFQKIPRVSHFSKHVQEEMFRSGISHFYSQQNPHSKLRNDQLRQLNKEMRTYLINQVQHYNKEEEQPIETTEEKTQRIFTEKQKMCEQITSKPDLPKSSDLFREPIQDEDGVIQNMDELIVQYQEQRKQEVPAYDPIPVNIIPSSPLEMLKKLEARIEAIEKMMIIKTNDF